ncbi:hypothetical protein ACDF64_12555 [Agromyces sp. MMS24-JH15]|uniref:hypothetical protein n=1 Tax=Agromyces sp. MMS24-JH15 TaxID=3243765 RepID=UPI0037489887
MDITGSEALIGWFVLTPCIAIAAVFSVLAFFLRPAVFLWLAIIGLALALLASSLLYEVDPSGYGPVVAVLAIVTAAFGGGPAASWTLGAAMGGTATPGQHGGIIVTDRWRPGTERPVTEARREVLRGGQTIGLLERIATAGVILAGFPEGLAIVIAVKGVGRFTELESAETRERFIIGTLASLIWACSAALVGWLAIR